MNYTHTRYDTYPVDRNEVEYFLKHNGFGGVDFTINRGIGATSIIVVEADIEDVTYGEVELDALLTGNNGLWATGDPDPCLEDNCWIAPPSDDMLITDAYLANATPDLGVIPETAEALKAVIRRLDALPNTEPSS